MMISQRAREEALIGCGFGELDRLDATYASGSGVPKGDGYGIGSAARGREMKEAYSPGCANLRPVDIDQESDGWGDETVDLLNDFWSGYHTGGGDGMSDHSTRSESLNGGPE